MSRLLCLQRAAPKLIDIEHEMDEMGEFMLTMAQERAENADVKANIRVKRGKFREVLADVIEEFDIQTVILGSSAGETGVVTAEYIQDLVDEIGEKTGVEFLVIDQGEIVSTFKP